MPNNKARKQFSIKDADSCKIYLRKIITVAEKCRYKLERYLVEGEEQLNRLKKSKAVIVSYVVYEDVLSHLHSVETYVLNVFGDMQTSSISYIKFRKQIKKLKRMGTDFGLPSLSNDIKEILYGFNEARNFENHIPESVLIAEQELIREGMAVSETEDPLEVYIPDFVTIDYYEDLLKQYRNLYDGVVELIGAAMKDYNALYCKEIELRIVHTETVIDTSKLEVGKRAAQAQK